jgi:hypothetical protein
MSAIDEGIVREYFEQNGFWSGKRANIRCGAAQKWRTRKSISWSTTRRGSARAEAGFFPVLERAAVRAEGGRGGEGLAHGRVHADRCCKSSPEIFGFLKQSVLKEAARFFPAESAAGANEPLTKILVLPSLPTAEPFRSQSVELLKAKRRGCDHLVPGDAARPARQD